MRLDVSTSSATLRDWMTATGMGCAMIGLLIMAGGAWRGWGGRTAGLTYLGTTGGRTGIPLTPGGGIIMLGIPGIGIGGPTN